MKKFLTLVATATLLSACDFLNQPAPDTPALDLTDVLTEQPTESKAKVTIVEKGDTFTCTPTAVYDGDGPVWCAEGPKLRLAGIAAREMNGECRSNQPCPTASAEQARDALVNLLGGPKGKRSTGHILVKGPVLTCQSEGQAVGSRTGAWCAGESIGDLSCAMVESGTVLKWDRYWKRHRC